MHRAIEGRIEEFLVTNDPKLDWVKPAVREHNFLPLYIGWAAALGIRPDGSFVRWNYEDELASVKPLTDPYWQRMSLCQGAKKYPELRDLLPDRPVTAQTCESCGGLGEVPRARHVVCECGGIGWIVPGEQKASSPG